MTKKEFATLSTQAQRAYVQGHKDGLGVGEAIRKLLVDLLVDRVGELGQWQREALPFLRELRGNYVLRCECDKVPLKALIERATGQEGEKSAPTTNTNKDPQ